MAAKTWVLLRGLGREVGHWGSFLEQFKSRFPNDEVIAIDLPGAGEFQHQPCPASTNGIFQFVRSQVVERSRSQGQFHLVALSLGAMVAIEWIRERHDDLASCVLINTSSRALSPFYYRLRWQIWREMTRIMAQTSPRERERATIEILMNNPEAKAEALSQWTKIATERPVSYVNFANQLLAAFRFRGLSAPTTVPVLLLNGLGDRLVEPSCSTALHEKWGWPIHRHPWGGHDLTWDDPAWVLDKIEDWTRVINA